jgi:hypothetical protein
MVLQSQQFGHELATCTEIRDNAVVTHGLIRHSRAGNVDNWISLLLAENMLKRSDLLHDGEGLRYDKKGGAKAVEIRSQIKKVDDASLHFSSLPQRSSGGSRYYGLWSLSANAGEFLGNE